MHTCSSGLERMEEIMTLMLDLVVLGTGAAAQSLVYPCREAGWSVTGACHDDLGIPGEELLTTSTQFMELDALPRRIVFVGGGYIAFEFAHIAARAGAQVQVLHRGSRPLEQFDPDLVAMLVQASRELCVEVHVNRPVPAIERQGDHLLVHPPTEPHH